MTPSGPSVEGAQLSALATQFMNALQARSNHEEDRAEELLRGIVKTEPRLAEPHMELARVLLDSDRLAESEGHARAALEHLEDTGPWTEEVPENVLRALAHGLLAEVLRRIADEDDVIFGDPERFKALVSESQHHFKAAAALDPSDEYASYYAFFMGPNSENGPEDGPGS